MEPLIIIQADEVLAFLANQSKNREQEVVGNLTLHEEVDKILTEKNIPKMSPFEFLLIIRNLKKDEYIEQEHPTEARFAITLRGALAHQKGGYLGHLQSLKTKEQRVRILEDEQVKQNNLNIKVQSQIRSLTFWVAVGTVGMLGWDILKYLIHYRHFWAPCSPF